MNFASVAAANLNIAATNPMISQAGSSAMDQEKFVVNVEKIYENDAKSHVVLQKSMDTINKAPGYRGAKSISSIIEPQSEIDAKLESISPVSNMPHNVVQRNDGDWTKKTDGKLIAVDLLSDLPVPTNTPLSPPHESPNLVSHILDTQPVSNLSGSNRTTESIGVKDIRKSTLAYLPAEEQPPSNSATTNFMHQHAAFDIEGRRSAGASFGSYFSPVPPPRPASALENVKSDSYSNANDTQYDIINTNFASTNNKQSIKEIQNVLPFSPKDFHNFNLAMSNLLLPTPIGGERRSKTNVNEFPPPVLDQQNFQQQMSQTWNADEKNWMSNISSNIPHSFHGINNVPNPTKQPLANNYLNYNGSVVNEDFTLSSNLNNVENSLVENSSNAKSCEKDFPVNSNDFWINNQIKSLGNYQILQNCLNNLPPETYVNNFFGSSSLCDVQQQNSSHLLPSAPPPLNFGSKMSLFGRNSAADPWSSNGNGVSVGGVSNSLPYCQTSPQSQPWKFANGGDYFPTTAQTSFAPPPQQSLLKDRPFAYYPPPPPTMNQPPPPQLQQFRSRQSAPPNPPPQQHGWSGWT
uniref:Uncharacterized protein n=1 Tax=Romanomermis culicivorax TaxID=13658 RepID=A0A915HMS3_ROMCU